MSEEQIQTSAPVAETNSNINSLPQDEWLSAVIKEANETNKIEYEVDDPDGTSEEESTSSDQSEPKTDSISIEQLRDLLNEGDLAKLGELAGIKVSKPKDKEWALLRKKEKEIKTLLSQKDKEIESLKQQLDSDSNNYKDKYSKIEKAKENEDWLNLLEEISGRDIDDFLGDLALLVTDPSHKEKKKLQSEIESHKKALADKEEKERIENNKQYIRNSLSEDSEYGSLATNQNFINAVLDFVETAYSDNRQITVTQAAEQVWKGLVEQIDELYDVYNNHKNKKPANSTAGKNVEVEKKNGSSSKKITPAKVISSSGQYSNKNKEQSTQDWLRQTAELLKASR